MIGVWVVVVRNVVMLVRFIMMVIFLFFGSYSLLKQVNSMFIVRLINSVGVKILSGVLELLLVSIVSSLQINMFISSVLDGGSSKQFCIMLQLLFYIVGVMSDKLLIISLFSVSCYGGVSFSLMNLWWLQFISQINSGLYSLVSRLVVSIKLQCRVLRFCCNMM